MLVFKLEPVTFQLGTITGKHVFLLVKYAPIHMIGWVLLEVYNAHIAFSPKGEMTLDLEEVDTDQITKKLLVIKTKTQTGQEEINNLLLWVPEKLWSSSSPDTGEIKTATPNYR